jgi:SAM-dependent methyltransferase
MSSNEKTVPTGIDRSAHEQNRLSWNAVTGPHNSHKRDQAGFLRGGGSTLYSEEIELVGDVSGQCLLHLQCNCGQDTLSFAQRGAAVTGVDISDEAIAFAQRLSEDSEIPGDFIRSDIYDWLAGVTARGEEAVFDIVFASYGVMIWLSNLTAWAEGIAAVLKPGGRFVLVEYHPSLTSLEVDWTVAYPAIGGRTTRFAEGIGDYVGFVEGLLSPSGYAEGVREFENPHPTVEFAWSVGDIVTALLDAGLTLRQLREYSYSNGFVPFPGFQPLGGGRFTMPADRPAIPMMFGIVAEKR